MEILTNAPVVRKITDITAQVRDPNRVNISIDGKYSFSLDIAQLAELDVKVGLEIDDTRLEELKTASQFGKLYVRALEYTLSRPHSTREVRDYLMRKTYDKPVRVRNRQGEMVTKIKPGIPKDLVELVMKRLDSKGHLDDLRFTRFWVENRQMRKGISKRKLEMELAKKGVAKQIVEEVLTDTARNDREELEKMVAKKAGKYDDEQKLIAYLARQGFSYDDIKDAINGLE